MLGKAKEKVEKVATKVKEKASGKYQRKGLLAKMGDRYVANQKKANDAKLEKHPDDKMFLDYKKEIDAEMEFRAAKKNKKDKSEKKEDKAGKS